MALHLCLVDKTTGLDYQLHQTNIFKSSSERMDTKFTIMNTLRNRVQLIGNLGNAPEVRNTENGTKMVRFSMATNEIYKNAKGEKVKETQWHNLIAWGKVAEIAEKLLVKGTEVAIDGKLVNNNYTDKEGNRKYSTEIHVNELLLFGKVSV